jgi:hypothetical protein
MFSADNSAAPRFNLVNFYADSASNKPLGLDGHGWNKAA